jgi:hypothetical protein
MSRRKPGAAALRRNLFTNPHKGDLQCGVPDTARIIELRARIVKASEAVANLTRIGEELLAMKPTSDPELLRINMQLANTARIQLAWSQDELERLLARQG